MTPCPFWVGPLSEHASLILCIPQPTVHPPRLIIVPPSVTWLPHLLVISTLTQGCCHHWNLTPSIMAQPHQILLSTHNLCKHALHQMLVSPPWTCLLLCLLTASYIAASGTGLIRMTGDLTVHSALSVHLLIMPTIPNDSQAHGCHI